jgi:hypothetical protein
LASQRTVSTGSQQLDTISREISACLKEFEAALRVVEALRAVADAGWVTDGRGDAAFAPARRRGGGRCVARTLEEP